MTTPLSSMEFPGREAPILSDRAAGFRGRSDGPARCRLRLATTAHSGHSTTTFHATWRSDASTADRRTAARLAWKEKSPSRNCFRRVEQQRATIGRPTGPALHPLPRAHLGPAAGSLALRGKGDSATGGVCRFLASSRAVMCSSSAQREAVASGGEMFVGPAREVSAGAAGHQRSRIVTAVQQPWIGRASLLVLAQTATVEAADPLEVESRFAEVTCPRRCPQ
jgi:hypothetical protein